MLTSILYAGTVADVSGPGDVVWSNPAYAQGAADGSYAQASYGGPAGHHTHYLWADHFGFSIPAGSTMNGVLAYVTRNDTSGWPAYDYIISLVVGGAVTGDNKYTVNPGSWATSGTFTWGSSSDLWGCTLTPAVVNAANFGFVVSATMATGGSHTVLAMVDAIGLAIDYTPPASGYGQFIQWNGD